MPRHRLKKSSTPLLFGQDYTDEQWGTNPYVPIALPPKTATNTIPPIMFLQLDDVFFNNLLSQANSSPRMRSHYTLHKKENEAVQRFCVGLKKGTYIRPHHHQSINKWELLIVLKGSVVFLIFDSNGLVLERFLLNQTESLAGLEIEPNTWHTVFPITDEAVFLEVKEGPYTPTVASDFATWAPEEGHSDVPEFQEWLKRAKKGDIFNQELVRE